MYVTCEAFVLRKYRYSETSYILHLFTREYGRINALAKGAKREKSPMNGHFDRYNLEEVTIYRKRRSDLDLATDANLLTEYKAIRQSPVIYSAACVLSEIVLKSCMLYDKHELAFDAFKEFLQSADADRVKPISLLVPALWHILRDLGFEPSVSLCMKCGKDDIGSFVLSPNEGGVICSDCLEGSRKELLDAGDLAVLRHIAGEQRVRLSYVSDRILSALIMYTEYVLGMSVKSGSILLGLVQGRL